MTMKKSLAFLACLLALAPSVWALGKSDPYYADSQKVNTAISQLTGTLNDIKAGKTVKASDLQTLLGSSQGVPADGETTLTGSFQTKSLGSMAFGGTGRIMTNITDTSFKLNLKVVNGNVVGLVATEEIRYGNDQYDPKMAEPTTTSWTYGPKDFIAAHQSDIPNGGQGVKPPVSIPSAPLNAAGQTPTPKQESSATCGNTVSPSAPGCVN